ncbi:MAG: PQQ-binding-like beta-propeller repeat protein [Phycisphaerae bacterium]
MKSSKSAVLLSIGIAAVAIAACRPALRVVLAADGPASAPTTRASQPAATAVGWRGDGTGLFPDANPPTVWEADKKTGILWSVKVGKGTYSSPIVVGDKVFVAAEPDLIICLDAATGKKLWEKATTFKDLPKAVEEAPGPRDTGNVASTPASDGKCVYMTFGNSIVTCFDLDGNRKWIGYVEDPCPTEHGRSTSPVICGDKLVATMNCLRAFDAKTGKEVWKNEKIGECYGTPATAKVDGQDVIVAASGQVVRASDGTLLAKGLGSLTYASPFVVNGVIYGTDVTAYAGKLPDKIAEPLKIKKLWEQDLEGEFFSSGAAYDGLFYAVSNQGRLFVLDASDGKIVYQKALEIPNASGAPGMPPGNVYPSISVAGKLLFVSNDQGDTLVIQPGKEYKELAHNHLNDGHAGMPFFAGKRIYVRGDEKLFCLGQ